MEEIIIHHPDFYSDRNQSLPLIRLLLIALLFALLSGCISKPPGQDTAALKAVLWASLEGWPSEQPELALAAFRKSCEAVASRPEWSSVCAAAASVAPADELQAIRFFEQYFQPYQVRNETGGSVGLVTGYYAPELEGSRVRTEKFRYPLYRQPDDLLIVDLGDIYPELKAYRLRGRLEGNRVIPYFDRREIDADSAPLAGTELFWVADPVELFFLHIQGSGRVRLENGDQVMVNYAAQNGHPYRSIGKLLLEQKQMTPDQMSMQNIRRWVREHPDEGRQLLAENPSYVFFRELPETCHFPLGALGIELTPRRSLAVDPRTIPLGAPVFLSTSFPGSDRPLRRLMVAQDTGGAIKGRVRADFFWGMGDEAEGYAGQMKQEGRLWVLLPKINPASVAERNLSCLPQALSEVPSE